MRHNLSSPLEDVLPPPAPGELDNAAYRVLLLADDSERARWLRDALVREGHVLMAHLRGAAELIALSARLRPDVICIDIGQPDDHTLELLSQLDHEAPRPVVLFGAASDQQTMRQALRAGVSVYIAEDLRPKRMATLLDIAVARFELMIAMRTELDHARTRLADQRDIERAKGVLMKRRGLDEAAAYGLLRKLSMDRKQRIGELARTVLAAADVL